MTNAYLKRVLEKDAFLLFDGAFGTMLLKQGVPPNIAPALLNVKEPQIVTAIHELYVKAGAQVITANTFDVNRLYLEKLECDLSVHEIYSAAISCARAAHPAYVAADIGPLSVMLEPYGDLSCDEASQLFSEQAHAAQAAGADIIIIETMADINEAKIAVRACKASCNLPVFVTMTFGENGRSFMGATPEDAACVLTEEGADALGINCSLGPVELLPLIRTMRAQTTLPLIAQANAGLPCRSKDGSVTYPFSAEEYASAAQQLIEAGVTIIGGCCGTNPSYIKVLQKMLICA